MQAPTVHARAPRIAFRSLRCTHLAKITLRSLESNSEDFDSPELRNEAESYSLRDGVIPPSLGMGLIYLPLG